jgi:hypothetical protein
MTSMIKPYFSPEINWGHIMQAGVLVITIGGGAITSYISVRSEIQNIRSEMKNEAQTIRGDLRGDIQVMRAEFSLKSREHEMRILNNEDGIKVMQAESKEFQRDMRAALSKITEMLGDVRVQMGSGKSR